MSPIFNFFKSDPAKKLNKAYEEKLHKAMLAQRSGDIEGYSNLTKEAEEIRAELDKLEASSSD